MITKFGGVASSAVDAEPPGELIVGFEFGGTGAAETLSSAFNPTSGPSSRPVRRTSVRIILLSIFELLLPVKVTSVRGDERLSDERNITVGSLEVG